MKEEMKNYLLDVFGVIFIVLGITAIINSVILTDNASQILWLCYFGLVIIGSGMIMKNDLMILSQLNILTFPLIFWNIDFLYYLFTSSSLWGITDYMFIYSTITLGKLISLQHLFTIPLSIYALYLIKINNRKSWIWSFAQMIIIYIFVVSFTNPIYNINCVFKPCLDYFLYVPLPYIITWFATSLIIISVTATIINWLPFIQKKRFKK
jgi:hypothetical protein